MPEKSIGRSFKNTNLVNGGFFANWEVPPYFNLTDVKNEQDKKGRFKEFFLSSKAQVLVCAHANSNLGDVVRRVMNNSTGHIVAMPVPFSFYYA